MMAFYFLVGSFCYFYIERVDRCNKKSYNRTRYFDIELKLKQDIVFDNGLFESTSRRDSLCCSGNG